MPKVAEPITEHKSRRVTVAELATRLRVTYGKARAMVVDDGLFTAIRDGAAARGAPLFVPADEADYAELNGVEALQAYRKTKRRAKA